MSVDHLKIQDWVRHRLCERGFERADNGLVIYEQSSVKTNKIINNLLSRANYKKADVIDSPNFTITCQFDPAFLIIIDCQSDMDFSKCQHSQQTQRALIKKVQQQALCFSKVYTVLAIAVSGFAIDTPSLHHFLIPCGGSCCGELSDASHQPISDLLSFQNYYRLVACNPAVKKKQREELCRFAKSLHEFIWVAIKISEEDKPLLVSGTLMALMNKHFVQNFLQTSGTNTLSAWIHAINVQLNAADMLDANREALKRLYATVASLPNLVASEGQLLQQYPRGVLYELIKRIHTHIWLSVQICCQIDVVGYFYCEFLKYSGGNRKALGIVLTPSHIAELFCELANLTHKDTVLDLCAGTGGLLIAAMQSMLKMAENDQEKQDIKQYRLIGVESHPKMFALAVNNMLLRGGAVNLYSGSCFDPSITQSIRERTLLDNAIITGTHLKRPTVGFLNPPYGQSKSDPARHELYFVNHLLNQLAPGGLGVAIIPVGCVINSHPAKQEILKNHTLKAVMSMPLQLFYPVGVVTCIVVFEAHKPHQESRQKTWFGYWRDDGFVKTKHQGRLDLYGRWSAIKSAWLYAYQHRCVQSGQSIRVAVKASDEWVAEAYLATDYSTISPFMVAEVVKNHIIFNLSQDIDQFNRNALMGGGKQGKFREHMISFSSKKYERVDFLFEVNYGVRLHLNQLTQHPAGINVVSASGKNNGVTARVSLIDSIIPMPAGAITVALGGSILSAFVQEAPFYNTKGVAILIPKQSMSLEEKLYLCQCIMQNRFKYSAFGREADRTLKSLLLPVLTTKEKKLIEKFITSLPYHVNFKNSRN